MHIRLKKHIILIIEVIFIASIFCACACSSSSQEKTPATEKGPLTLNEWRNVSSDDTNAQEFFREYLDTNEKRLDELIGLLSACDQLQGADGDCYMFDGMSAPEQKNEEVSFEHVNSVGTSYSDSGSTFVEIKKDPELYGEIENLFADGLFERILIVRNGGHSEIFFDVSSSRNWVSVQLFNMDENQEDADKYIENFNSHVFSEEDKLFNLVGSWYLQYSWYGAGVGNE